MVRGSCLCGGVAFEVTGPMRPVIACHCGQCRKTSGHFWAASHAADKDIRMLSDATLAWYPSSETARRGFCNTCGSSLFWELEGRDGWSIGAGVLDTPTGLSMAEHIFVENKGDYYEICDNVPIRGQG